MITKILSAGAPFALALGASTTLLAEPLAAQNRMPAFTPTEAFTSLEGEWTGELTYRDYQSNKLESIPVDVAMETLPDGETMVQRYTYTDPGFQVYITSLIAVKDGLLTGATARAGRAFETYKKDIALSANTSKTDWTAVLTSEATDGDRPARVRETMVRDAGSLKVLKEVDFLDDDKDEWMLRNEITLAAK